MLTTTHSPDLENDVARIFAASLALWKADEKPTSLMMKRAMHPAYQRIIGLGPAALPLILRSLEKEPDMWFWALESITGENPVPEADAGRIPKMVAAWLKWGREHGYLAK
jgi:hypothetical protein